MNTKILIVCLLFIGKSVESSWNSFQMSEPHDVNFHISCCKNALERRENLCCQIDATTQGWTDDQYECKLQQIREQATYFFAATGHQRSLLAYIQRNSSNEQAVEQLMSSLRDTIVSYLYIQSCFEKAQNERNARLGCK